MAEDRMLSDEILLGLIKANGGGGGTSDYSQLSNKPQINSVVLTGNKSLHDLGIASETALATKQDTLSFDAEPTEDSANPVTSGGVYDALEDKADQSEVDDIAENTESETATLTGNPITLSDALATDAISVVAEIEPSQDLHGYGKPWSGGAGKNKAPMTVAGIKAVNTVGTWSGNAYTHNDVTFTINTDNDENVIGITANGTASNDAIIYIPLTMDAPFVANGCQNAASDSTYYMVLNIGGWYSANRVYGTDKSFDTGSAEQSALVVVQGYTATNLTFYPMIRLSTETDATFEPYTNICPISGMDSVTVTATDGTDTTTATASLGTTIYGGSVDITGGSGSVTHAYAHAKDFVWGYNGTTETYLFEKTTGIPKAFGKFNIISDKLASEGDYAIVGRDDSATVDIKIPLSVASNDTEFAAWLNAENPEICYELATPTTLSLTPTALAMLEGENAISTDAEEVSVEYIKNTLAGRVKHLEDESGAVDYSTEEQKTGQKWIDGKDIYFKTVDIGALPNNTSKLVSTGITAIDTVIKLESIAQSTSGGVLPLPYVDDVSKSADILMSFSKTTGELRFLTGTDYSVYNAVVTIYYTKTT